jgi:glucosamine--fructose-6-phosphate aminotransferase (isomerizing)
MRAEALQAPAAVARLLAADGPAWQALADDLARQPPQAVLTVARGSSDQAAQYLAYLTTARLGRLVTSLPMSLVTLYPPRLRCQGLLAIALSQSGQSPDLVAPLQHIAAGGGRTLAFVNDTATPARRPAQRHRDGALPPARPAASSRQNSGSITRWTTRAAATLAAIGPT